MLTGARGTACRISDLGLIDYAKACAIQKSQVAAVIQGGAQTLILCEHPSVLTLGRLADGRHLLLSKEEIGFRGISVVPIDRGGDVTLHAPGQLVIYPILDLNNFGRDLRGYLFHLEQVAIDFLGSFDIVACRFPGQTGAWVGDKKIASIGVGVRKWVSFHGIAINISTDLTLFSMIKPCGLDARMTSLLDLTGIKVEMAEAKHRAVASFRNVFHLNI